MHTFEQRARAAFLRALYAQPQAVSETHRTESTRTLHEGAMNSSVEPEKWGAGAKAQDKAFETVKLGAGDDSLNLDLIFGEHPHSRADNNIYARFPDGHIEAFDGHRVHVRFEYSTRNYLKASDMTGNEVRKGGAFNLYFNDRLVYSEFARTPEHALARLREKLPLFFEHPVQLWREQYDGLIGRKVYWRDTPAIVTDFFPDQGALIVQAEDGHTFSPPAWAVKDGEAETWKYEYGSRAKTDFFSPHLWWFRD